MAYFKITPNKKGRLQARIQVSGKDINTGKNKLFVKTVYNENDLTEAKFRKFVEKESIAFEEDVKQAYEDYTEVLRTKVLTFSELMQEWKASVKANLSINYYSRICEVEKQFTAFLMQQKLDKKPISAITVRDIQLFLNSFESYQSQSSLVKVIKPFSKPVSFRQLEKEGIINRCSSYKMNAQGHNIRKSAALKICNYYNLNFYEYFEEISTTKQYSYETIKGKRRILRTLFNEAVRYEWISKNPVCATKIGAGNSNTCLKPVEEKEVFSILEAKRFLQQVNAIPDYEQHKRVCIKLALLCGLRTAEIFGLKWDDIDFERNVVKIRRNRLYEAKIGYYEKEPKTKTSKRDVPMPNDLVKELQSYKNWFRIASPDFDDHPYDFYIASNLKREPLYIQALLNWVKQTEDACGLKHVSPHGLRHTYCSILLSNNVPIQTVSKYMGHSDSTITLQVYSHFIPDTQEKAVSAINSIT